MVNSEYKDSRVQGFKGSRGKGTEAKSGRLIVKRNFTCFVIPVKTGIQKPELNVL
jgi:hypothetical protein